ncbi:hypothetical protein Tco_0053413 [Tanacetum coccineum]
MVQRARRPTVFDVCKRARFQAKPHQKSTLRTPARSLLTRACADRSPAPTPLATPTGPHRPPPATLLRFETRCSSGSAQFFGDRFGVAGHQRSTASQQQRRNTLQCLDVVLKSFGSDLSYMHYALLVNTDPMYCDNKGCHYSMLPNNVPHSRSKHHRLLYGTPFHSRACGIMEWLNSTNRLPPRATTNHTYLPTGQLSSTKPYQESVDVCVLRTTWDEGLTPETSNAFKQTRMSKLKVCSCIFVT